jgi:hypothetical protein
MRRKCVSRRPGKAGSGDSDGRGSEGREWKGSRDGE